MPDSADDPVILRAVLDLAPDMVSLSQFSGVVEYVNPAGLELVGLTESYRSLPLTTADFFTADGLDVAPEVEAGLSRYGQWRGHSELRHFGTDEAIPVAVSTFVVHRDNGEPALIASVIRDRRCGHRRDAELQATAVSATHYAAEQKALAELSRLAVDAELPQLLDAAVAAAATLTGVETASIVRYSGSASAELSIESCTRAGASTQATTPGDMAIAAYAIEGGATVVCADIDVESRFDTSAMAAHGFHSGLAVPVVAATGAWGALMVHSRQAREYSEREVSFLDAVASVLSTALRRIELDQQLIRRSLHDALTGLPNRTLAYTRIDEALARARDTSGAVALLLLDIDDFKIINDSLGHDTGDRALVRFAHRLCSATRAGDTVARLGGDEFLIICEGVDSVTHAEELAHHITTSIAAPFSSISAPVPLSASIGIAVSESTTTRRELIHRADLAMYRAKENGTGGHAVFDTGDLYDADRIRSLSIDLRSALTRGELTLHYQPLVDIATDRIVAVEALARWTHPVHGEIAPAEFVAIAERTGLATELGAWALRTACTCASAWRRFAEITIRVNVSALELRNPAFPRHVAAILAETGLPASALGLEITETMWVSDTARVADTLTELHAMGVALLLDDLGKGHSSISYLDRYPMFECFKIDKSYIAALPCRRSQAIVTAIVALAKAFDVLVVGEGVETQEQLDALVSAGCDLAQGYLLGRPVDAAATGELLRSIAVHSQ
ncbi:EAL domain-containing protein [Rhodococcus sp. I2R]|uniref:sensor domain-containing protein n=1 Tax=Rhodococcus sp. I2R TaxID=2855445 RepID=UPI001E2F480A|nr:EAL domain-containing protein [Rhodococcus sp. I2R]MCC8930938.1 EAL domain-containing protein [Rhodococcus sp. I2R]